LAEQEREKYMRIASVKPNDLAVVNDGTLVFVSDALAEQGLLPKGASMIDFVTRYDSLKHSLESVIARGKKVSIDSNLLKPPVERPSKIWAAAFNYREEPAISKTPRAEERP
jgi:hypothetical protein